MVKAVVYKNHWFWKHGVMVKVPIHRPGIKPVHPELPAKKAMPATIGVFHPLRLVINLKMVKADPPHDLVTDFSPHIIIRVRYEQKDLDDAKQAGGKLALGYWNGKHWVRFTNAHHFDLVWETKMKKGWAEVRLTHLIDPPIALGT